jgi:hypothetical protein
MSGLEVSFLVGAGVSLAGVVAVLIWLPARASPVPRDPPGERVIVPDYQRSDDDHGLVVTLERGNANEARRPKGEDITTTIAVRPVGAPSPLEGTRQPVPADG